MADLHPCLTCGACCASFRVDFSVFELDENGGGVPSGLAVEVNDSTCRMRGTDYEWRPNPCRELEPGIAGCDRERARHGLPPLPHQIL